MDEESDILYDFLLFLLTREYGISSSTARRFASQFDSLEEVLNHKDRIGLLTRATGEKLIVHKGTVAKIKNALDAINPQLSLQQNYILSIGRVFSRRQIENIQKLTLDDINPNPFLLKALHLKSAEELIEILGFARITRSIVTSFGFFFEDLLVASGATKVKERGFDIYKLKDGVRFFIQCKSGTNDMDKDQIVFWINKIRELEKEDVHARGLIGMPYGKRDSNTVSLGLLKQYFKEELESHVLIGKELWEFISGKPEFHAEVLELLEEASMSILKNRSVYEVIKEKIFDMINEFHSKYGQGKEAITNFLQSNF